STTLVGVDEGIIHDHMRSLKIEFETHFPRTHRGEGVAHAALPIWRAEQQKETATAGAGDLASQSALVAGQSVHFVDARVGNAAGNPLFRLPAFVQQMSEALQV